MDEYPADLDSFATGRGIRGDGLTNWEEIV